MQAAGGGGGGLPGGLSVLVLCTDPCSLPADWPAVCALLTTHIRNVRARSKGSVQNVAGR